MEQQWSALRFGAVKVVTVGTAHQFEAQVFVDPLDPAAVRVELYADGTSGDGPVRFEMTRDRSVAGGGYAYRAQVPASRPAADYAIRIIPHHDGVAVPLETAHILWQR